MYPIGVVGPGAERMTQRLVGHLAEHGRVSVLTHRQDGGNGDADNADGSAADGGAVVEATTTGRFERAEQYRTAGATPVYELGNGQWRAVGDAMDEREALYAVAPACEFCIVEGTIGARLPHIALDDPKRTGSAKPAGDAGSTAGSDNDTAYGPVLATAAEPETIDLDDLREALVATEPIETLDSLVERAKSSPRAPESGAIATFTGRVRAQEDAEDTPTEYLEFEKYQGVADERMAEISTQLEERDGIYEVLLHHRSGRLEYGEDIVFVVVLAGHRGEAFRTVEDGIDRLKAEVPIFKKEVTIEEEFWVHDRP